MPDTKLVTFAALIVLMVWVLTSVNGIVRHDYEGLQIVTPIMLVLSGWLFARDFFRRRNGK